MRSVKYLSAYIVPVLAIVGLLSGGSWAYATVIFAFVIVPFLDQLLPRSEANVTDTERDNLLASRIFDWLLYANVPIVYGIVLLFIYQMNTIPMTGSELLGHILSVGIVIGACGINVGHELGHRSNRREQFLAKALLLPALYQHFFIEHNRGHHKNVATPQDPATARKGELLYTFWFRSLYGSYKHAWELEQDRLHKQKLPFWSWHNLMVRFSLVQFIYILSVSLLSSNWQVILSVLIAGLVGVLLLESINYIEHYGLLRNKLSNGQEQKQRQFHPANATC